MYSCKLRAIPMSISQLNNLEELSIQDNDFSSVTLPDDFFMNLTSLKKLLMYSCKLRAIPMSISQLNNLEELHINDNDFSSVTLPDDFFMNLTSLKKLLMYSCKLRAIPMSISQLNNLEELYIHDNDFSSVTLPDDFFMNMTSLKKLFMYGCKLRAIPMSLSLLNHLEHLYLSGNYFSEGLPNDVFTGLTSLKVLDLSKCELKQLPESIQNLQELKVLDIADNFLSNIPSSVCKLGNLETLKVRCESLTSLNTEILKLTKLSKLDDLSGLSKIICPPKEVCRQGIFAIRQYYTDLEAGEGKNLPSVTVAVIGSSMAGKTSLIKTLQSKFQKRVLTNRETDAANDETTKVFEMEEVEVENSVLRLIDMGGNEIYHTTYQLTLNQNCIPVIVVSIEQYDTISKQTTQREAARRLAFDYMSHLYLAHPSLGKPRLVFTHKDKFSVKKFFELRVSFIQVSRDLCRDILEEEKSLDGQFSRIEYFLKSAGNVFTEVNIYDVSSDNSYSEFERLKTDVFLTCQSFVVPLPKIWEDVEIEVLALNSAYNTVEEIYKILLGKKFAIKKKQFEVILQFMQDRGKVLRYPTIDVLAPYIFHKLSEMTKLMCILYHHDRGIWEERRSAFTPYRCDDLTRVEVEDFDENVSKLVDAGIVDEKFLFFLIQSETSFKGMAGQHIALAVLKAFRLIFGPLTNTKNRVRYIVPYLVPETFGEATCFTGDITLQVNIAFKGLSLPQYAYNQMTVGLLEPYPDDITVREVKRNGGRVFDDGLSIQLVHDYKAGKATIYVSSAVNNILGIWEKLILLTNNTLRHVMKAWPASRPVVVSPCSHCLTVNDPHPAKITNPGWAIRSLESTAQGSSDWHTEAKTVECKGVRIPSILKYPRTSMVQHLILEQSGSSLTSFARRLFRPGRSFTGKVMKEEKVKALELFVNQLKVQGKEAITAGKTIGEEQVRNLELFVDEVKVQGKEAITAEDGSSQSDIGSKQNTLSTDDLGVMSDDDDYILPKEDEATQKKEIRLPAVRTTNPKIKELFNSENVFAMTRKRGRAMIINNKEFDGGPTWNRNSSDVDVDNLKDMLKAFKFEVVVHRNLKAEDILKAVQAEVELKDHEDYGCHFLVIMSHGVEGNLVFGTDMKLVKLTDVFDLLTPINFPGMRGKPKVIIVEACSGDRVDVGRKGIHPERPPQSGSEKVKYETVSPPPSQIGRRQEAESIEGLNYDDLLVLKSSVESFVSVSHGVCGSLMIRGLVSTMYKHACHRDLFEIFKHVQHIVRKVSIARQSWQGGQLAVVWDTLTHKRKLYLFPGFNGTRENNP